MTADTPIRSAAFPAGRSRPLATPLLPTVAWVAEGPDDLDALYAAPGSGHTYAREGHPNATALALRLDAAEAATGGLVTGSGMAAMAAALLGTLRAGDHVVGGDQLYGRSLRLLAETLPRLGIATDLADPTDAAAIGRALRPQTRAIVIETVSNPTLRVADLAGIAALAQARGLCLIVDNTFTTPRALRPLAQGADVVVHSVTKLLAGHSDVTLGYVAARDPARMAAIRDHAVTAGLTPSPFDCWLAERGHMTFDLRHDRAEATARRLADLLAGLPGVRRVLYPGRADHPDHARARDLLGAHTGTMVSFDLEGGRGAANAFAAAMRDTAAFAPTLGDVSTTLSHPPTSSHRAMTPAARAALGIGEGFFRVSVGIEAPEALLAAFAAGVAAARSAAASDGAADQR
jgi:cystathionine gamma-synthase